MKERLKELKYAIEDKIKDLCGEITPDKRITVIVICIVIMTVANLYITISSIYEMGKSSGKKENLEMQHIQPLDLRSNYTDSTQFRP